MPSVTDKEEMESARCRPETGTAGPTLASDRGGMEGSTWARLRAEAAGPRCADDLADGNKPGFTRSRAGAARSMQVMPRRGRLGPVQAGDLGDDVGSTLPWSEIGAAGAGRAEDRKGREGPRTAKSATESEKSGPKRLKPTVKTADPARRKLLIDKKGSTWPESSADTANASRAGLCSGSDGSKVTPPGTDEEDMGPTRDEPDDDATRSRRAKDLGKKGGSTWQRSDTNGRLSS